MLRWIEADQNSLPDVLFYSPVSSNDDIDHSLSIIRTWMPSRCVIYMSVSLSRGTFNITCINCTEVEPCFLFFHLQMQSIWFWSEKGMCNFLRLLNKLWYKEKIEQVFTDITLWFHLRWYHIVYLVKFSAPKPQPPASTAPLPPPHFRHIWCQMSGAWISKSWGN